MEVKKREEIDDSLKWNLEDLAKDFAEVDERLEKLEKSTEEFISNYKGKIVDEDIFLKATEITEKNLYRDVSFGFKSSSRSWSRYDKWRVYNKFAKSKFNTPPNRDKN